MKRQGTPETVLLLQHQLVDLENQLEEARRELKRQIGRMADRAHQCETVVVEYDRHEVWARAARAAGVPATSASQYYQEGLSNRGDRIVRQIVTKLYGERP